MKPEEIMIGDWVNFLIDITGGETEYDSQTTEYQPMQIVSISAWVNNDGEVESAEGVINDIDQVKPISLTPEILEKNGFTGGEYKSWTGDVWYLEEEGFRKIGLTMSRKESTLWGEKIKPLYPDSIGHKFVVPNIKFVHQLQHALRLCGIDKEITI